jgi:hypothetical protein
MRWCGVLAALAVAAACSPPATIQDTLLEHRDRGDVVAIRAHGWDLWQHLAGGDHLGWEDWVATEQLFQHAPAARPRLRPPRPFRHGDAIESETLPVMFDVLFDPHGARHITTHRLDQRAVLGALGELPPFPSDALAVKLTWYAVRAHGLTAMPIWDGEPANADGNPDRTWSRAIAVDPDRAVIPDGETADVELAGRTVTARVIPLAAFLARDLDTEGELASARLATHDPTLARGDHVALVAAHVTTKEIPDWTWQTYWWHDAPEAGRFAADRPATLRGPAAHYLMDATYSTETPCFNPWLEARFPDGLASNCITCHQRAVVGAADYLPVTRGRLAADDPYFRGHLATDFLWSVAFEAR